MKIIKAGNLNVKLRKTTCSDCGCVFSWKEGERGTRFVQAPKNESAWVVKCPQKGCGKENYES